MINTKFKLVSGESTLEAISFITQRIPCFVDLFSEGDNIILLLTLRAEDYLWVELILASLKVGE